MKKVFKISLVTCFLAIMVSCDPSSLDLEWVFDAAVEAAKKEQKKEAIEAAKKDFKAQMAAYAEIVKAKFSIDIAEAESYTEIDKTKISSRANIEQSEILAKTVIEIRTLQALLGAVQIKLNAKTKSKRTTAHRKVGIAEAVALSQISKAKGPVAKASEKIIKAMANADTEQQLIESVATIELVRILWVAEK